MMGNQLQQVIQQDRTGCGIACVATIACTSYSKVRHMACIQFGWREDGVFYTMSLHLARLLDSLGYTAGRGRAVRHWESLPNLAIVAINPHKEDSGWHWVVFVRDDGNAYVIDPRSKRKRRTDFGRMRLRSCIPILSNT